MTLAAELAAERAALAAAGLWRDPEPPPPRGLDLCTNDYLGLAGAASPAAGPAPGGAGASRLVEGEHAAHRRAERALARWVGAEDALLFSSGYAANLGALQCLAGPGDRVVSDALNHASLIDGCRLSRAEVVVTPHLDLGAVERALAAPRRGRALVVTESLFSMDGDGPDLRRLRAICDQHRAALFLDEAHALGVLGPAGAGRAAEAGVAPDVLVGTLGKALGLQGAFVAGAGALRAWLWNRARSFVFSTATAPVLAELAARRVVEVAAAEGARATLQERRATLTAALRAAGLAVPDGLLGPIVPVLFGAPDAALAAADRARAAGFRVVAIRPPTVPAGTARVRLTLRPVLDPADFPRLAAALRGRAEDEAGAPRGAAPLADPALPHIAAPTAATAASPTAATAASPTAASPTAASPTAATAASPTAASPTAGLGAAPRVLVVGTGTGVGKTALGVALLGALGRARPALAAAGVKLVETGVVPGEPGSDAARLARAGTVALRADALVTFPEPLSPHLAARRAGAALTAADCARALGEALRSRAAMPPEAPPSFFGDMTSGVVSLLLLETAGGLFSPLNDRETGEDLAALLDPALIVLVAPDRLGVLHEIAACRRALRPALRDRTVVALNRPAEPDPSTGSNAAELVALGLGPVLAVLPELQTAEPSTVDAALAALVARLIALAAPAEPAA